LCLLAIQRLNKVICTLDINPLVIDEVSLVPVRIDGQQFQFIFLGLLFVFKLHFHKAESSASTCGPVPHDNGVRNEAELPKILNKVLFYNERRLLSPFSQILMLLN
jgi:hypothetical protein